MIESAEFPARDPEDLIQQYFDGLRRGRVVDMLDVFAPDAFVRDASGRARRSIRQMAASFVSYRHPTRLDIEDVRGDGEMITVIVSVKDPKSGRTRRYRDSFRLHRGRVASLTIDPVAAH